MKPTNLVFIMADEHNASFLGCAGHPMAKTPNLDALAASGTRFTSAYTPSPLCVPARAAMATGRYVHDIGYWDGAIAYDGKVPGWQHRLQKSDHRVVSIGKLHYRQETDATGFDRQILPMHVEAGGLGQLWGLQRDPLPVFADAARKMLGPIGAGHSSYNAYDERVASGDAEPG